MWIFLLLALSGFFVVLQSGDGANPESPSPEKTTSVESLHSGQIIGPGTAYSDSNSGSRISYLECRYQPVVPIRELVEFNEKPRFNKERIGS